MPYEEKARTLKLKPAKLLVLEGMHIFMNPEITNNVSSLINLKVFIDSDSDVRLSRRVYQDTQERNLGLN
jgi:uridine kinase